MPEGVSNDAKRNSIDETRMEVGYGYSEREEWKQICRQMITDAHRQTGREEDDQEQEIQHGMDGEKKYLAPK